MVRVLAGDGYRLTKALDNHSVPRPRGAERWDLELAVLTARGSRDRYALAWVHPALCHHNGYGLPQGPADEQFCGEWRDGDVSDRSRNLTHVSWRTIQHVTTLSPQLRTHDDRLSDVPEPTDADVDAMESRQPGSIEFFGGRDEVLEELRKQRRIASRYDRSDDRWDWDELAERIAGIANGLTPPTPTTRERLQIAGARIQETQDAHAAAKRSAAGLAQNAHQQGGITKLDMASDLGVTRPTLDTWLATKPTDLV